MIARGLLFFYDILLVDLYGVLWSGTQIFDEAADTMKTLVASGKKVVILSNASMLSEELVKKYDAQNLSVGVHFTDFVTSGNVLRYTLLNGDLHFKSVKDPKKYFVYGAQNDSVFADSKYEKTENLDEADFVYVSVVRFSDAEREQMPEEMKKYLYVARAHGSDRVWDSVSIEPYLPQLKVFLSKKKPLVIANPDKFAICSVLETPESTSYVSMATVKQGYIGEEYQRMGGEVFAIGKPFPQIYKYALEGIARSTGESFENICKMKIAMIGDSLSTDILGAANASRELGCDIDSIMVMTGISAGEMSIEERNDVSKMMDFFRAKGVVPTRVISALDVNADVIF